MSSPYTPEPVSIGSILLPQDGTDYVKAAAINPALQAIADGVKYNTERLHWHYGGSMADTLSVIGDVNTTSYSDVIELFSIDVVPNSRFRIWYNCHIYAPTDGAIKLVVGPNKVDAAWGAFAVCNNTLVRQYLLMGFGDALPNLLDNGKLRVFLQAKTTSGSVLEVWNPSSLIVEIENP